MWFNCDCVGITLLIFGYLCVGIAEVNLNCIALFQYYKECNPLAFILSGVFQIIIIMAIWSHTACMVEDPGSLPKKHKYINENLLSVEQYRMYKIVKDRIEANRTSNPSQDYQSELERNERENVEISKLIAPHEVEDQEELDEAAKTRLVTYFTNICYKCNSIKPPKVHHCSLCKRCIARMDHHCPWMNNCIGIRNTKQFVLFLIYSALTTLYIISVDIGCLTHCIYDDCDAFDLGGVFVFLVISGLLCIIFFTFSVFMIYSQFFLIINDTSTIDTLKKIKATPKKPAWQLIKDVFGGDFSYKWLLPLSIDIELTHEGLY